MITPYVIMEVTINTCPSFTYLLRGPDTIVSRTELPRVLQTLGLDHGVLTTSTNIKSRIRSVSSHVDVDNALIFKCLPNFQICPAC